MDTIFSIILAILGLGFLVFIHELGHYIMARRVGMRVEAFAIGFGKPIITWMRDGVKWQICWLPFGGYVKIAGMQKEGNKEPHEIKDGFFGSRPIDRIKVAVMGPVVNLVFAFLAFTALWALGGREKPFSEFTKRIGWMDQKSALFDQGVRPGDELMDLDGKPFKGYKDLMLAAVTDDDESSVRGFKIDYLHDEKTPFEYNLKTYKDPRSDDGLVTVGILSPARYLIYDKFPDGHENPLIEGSPLVNSGIKYGDRLFWVDGELVFSIDQLRALLTESTVFMTVKRNGQIIHSKIPRVKIDDFKLTQSQRGDLDDWRYEANLTEKKIDDLHFIPYVISYDNIVESKLNFIDKRDQEKAFGQCTRCNFFNPLQPGDEILAIDGLQVSSGGDLLSKMQTLRSVIIVQREQGALNRVSWDLADQGFDKLFKPNDLTEIIASLGTNKPLQSSGNLVLLKTITPKSIMDFPPSKDKEEILRHFEKQKEQIEKIDSSEKRLEYLNILEKAKLQPYSGIKLQDKIVRYNPNPYTLFTNVFDETWRTLTSLITGYISPKWLSGPVGIVHVVQKSWADGYKEVLFWMGVISLNLGFLNLLPVPVLDGGHITLSAVEMVTKKPIKAKTMEKLVIPFVFLLIGMIIYVTYHDLSRIFLRFFQ